MKKLPQITLMFWIMKIAATTLGETAGDLLAQTLNVGYAISSVILVGLFLISLVTQLRADKFHPALYWTVILSTSTAGTTMSDFMDRSAGLGYAKGSMVLIALLIAIFVVWKISGHSFDVQNISTFRGEILYWTAILISNTLGTAFGDFLADDSGLGFGGTAILIAGSILLTVVAMKFTPISNTLLFWVAFVLTRPLGASVGDFFSKPTAKGGLGYGTIGASAILGGILVGLIAYTHWQQRQREAAAGAVGHAVGPVGPIGVVAPVGHGGQGGEVPQEAAFADYGPMLTRTEAKAACPTCAAPTRLEARHQTQADPRRILVVLGATALVVLAVVTPVAVYTHSQAEKTDTVLAAVRTVQVDTAARAAADKAAADEVAAHDKAIAEAAAAKAIADRAATDKAATDKAAADKVVADKAAAANSAAHDKAIAEAAATKAIAGKADADAAANGSGASTSEKMPCQKMHSQKVPYAAVANAWEAVGSPPAWDSDHDGKPCEQAYGEMK